MTKEKSSEDEHVIRADVVSVRDDDTLDEKLDEVSCIAWFNGMDDDMTPIKITTPAGTFQLRDTLEIAFRLSERKNDKEDE